MLTAFGKCEKFGIPLKLELKMVSLQDREFLVRLTGKPVYNNEQAVIGIREVLQNIDKNKSNELNLQTSLDIICESEFQTFKFRTHSFPTFTFS